MKYLRCTLLFVALYLLSGCAFNQGRQDDALQQYELLTIEPRNFETNMEYAAQIRGRQDIKIIPRVEGYLEEIKIREGEHVRKGQLLFVIDQVSFQAAVRSAEASVMQAEARVSKSKNDLEGKQLLYENKVISDLALTQSKLDMAAAEADLEASRANLTSARNDLSFTELRSPSDGVVGSLPYRKGDFVGPSVKDGLTVVSENHQMYVYFSLSEERVMDYISSSGSVQNVIDGMPSLRLLLSGSRVYPYEGKVESISGIVDENTGAVSVRAVFPNPDGILLSGGTARILLPYSVPDAIVIPIEATYEILDKTYIFKVEGGVAKSCLVKTERTNNGKELIVTGGLEKGDVIIAKGAGLIREGTIIENID